MRILFLVPYPAGQAPSQRFRFEQYLPILTQKGHIVHISPFLSTDTWTILYKPGYIIKKATGILSGFVRRIGWLFCAANYDFVFIHREAAPLGPPLLEWIIAKLLRRKIIYDFDDAIWLSNTSETNRLAAGLKWHRKVANICGWAYKNSCGNSYLAAYACQFNTNTLINPTTIDTECLHNRVRDQATFSKLVIGWTGTHSTLKYLNQLVPVLVKLEEEGIEFEFRVISNQQPVLPIRSLVFVPWRKETEIEDLLEFHIGIMPLEDDLWAKGKCAFKALQYMALGIPALVSPVGMNMEVVQDGINGYICAKDIDWETSLRNLLADHNLRQKLGKAARTTVVERYSIQSNSVNFLKLFSV
jgi:glycosyltransferase involved in cell wall biosynthesis